MRACVGDAHAHAHITAVGASSSGGAFAAAAGGGGVSGGGSSGGGGGSDLRLAQEVRVCGLSRTSEVISDTLQ